jgi:hypothetical protein
MHVRNRYTRAKWCAYSHFSPRTFTCSTYTVLVDECARRIITQCVYIQTYIHLTLHALTRYSYFTYTRVYTEHICTCEEALCGRSESRSQLLISAIWTNESPQCVYTYMLIYAHISTCIYAYIYTYLRMWWTLTRINLSTRVYLFNCVFYKMLVRMRACDRPFIYIVTLVDKYIYDYMYATTALYVRTYVLIVMHIFGSSIRTH